MSQQRVSTHILGPAVGDLQRGTRGAGIGTSLDSFLLILSECHAGILGDNAKTFEVATWQRPGNKVALYWVDVDEEEVVDVEGPVSAMETSLVADSGTCITWR